MSAQKRPGALPVKLNAPSIEGQEVWVVWFGATRYLAKDGQVVEKAVRMTEEEAARAAAPVEVTA